MPALTKKKSRKKQLIFRLLINNDRYIDVFNTCLLHNTFILRRRENKCYFDIRSREKVYLYIYINTYSIDKIKSSNKIDKKKLFLKRTKKKERVAHVSSWLFIKLSNEVVYAWMASKNNDVSLVCHYI